jgi:hypothetical protein
VGPLAGSTIYALHAQYLTWTCTLARFPWCISRRKSRRERQYRAAYRPRDIRAREDM